jgi:hypothetical protein
MRTRHDIPGCWTRLQSRNWKTTDKNHFPSSERCLRYVATLLSPEFCCHPRLQATTSNHNFGLQTFRAPAVQNRGRPERTIYLSINASVRGRLTISLAGTCETCAHAHVPFQLRQVRLVYAHNQTSVYALFINSGARNGS